jgi:hypothetical protein
MHILADKSKEEISFIQRHVALILTFNHTNFSPPLLLFGINLGGRKFQGLERGKEILEENFLVFMIFPLFFEFNFFFLFHIQFRTTNNII